MPQSIRPEVMLRQVDLLAADLRQLQDTLESQVRALPLSGIREVVLTGDGDSYHASIAAEMTFQSLSDIACEPVSALRFAEYGVHRLRRAPAGSVLVAGVSASGNTTRVVQAITAAAGLNAVTVAVTGAPDSPVASAAQHVIDVAVPSPEPSPGIRTYQASLLGLLLLAIRLGEARGTLGSSAARATRSEISLIASTLAEANHDLLRPCAALAADVADAASMAVTGSGPNYGTALYAAAKLIEGAGVFAVGQDLEEWCHVERFALPRDMPVVVLAPPGRSRQHAIRMAGKAHEAGRRVVVVGPHGDPGLARYAWRSLPAAVTEHEELSPLLYHSFASLVASFLASQLGRGPFLT